eukprot:2702746-Pleurochrysis_carterae.AAC.2
MAVACRMLTSCACLHATRARVPHVLACRACWHAACACMLHVLACRTFECCTLECHLRLQAAHVRDVHMLNIYLYLSWIVVVANIRCGDARLHPLNGAAASISYYGSYQRWRQSVKAPPIRGLACFRWPLAAGALLARPDKQRGGLNDCLVAMLVRTVMVAERSLKGVAEARLSASRVRCCGASFVRAIRAANLAVSMF